MLGKKSLYRLSSDLLPALGVSDMKITLNNEEQALYSGAISDLSPLGFSIEVGLDGSDCFRDDTGRFICFDMELDFFPDSASEPVYGQAMVKSVRRISQQQCGLTIRFMNLEQGAYRRIAEYLSTPAIASEQRHFPQQLAG